MSSLDDILRDLPMDQIARRLGVDRATAEQAARTALPALVGGMQANAADPAGAASLTKAVGGHDPRVVEGGIDLDDVDESDGKKIVHNVFGASEGAVVQRLGAVEGAGGSGVVAKILPILAPIVLSLLAKRMAGGGASGGASAPGQGGGGVLGDVLGNVLGGGGGSPTSGSSGGFDIGEVLGSVLGGGSGKGGGGLGDLLGGLLGGGRR